MKMNRQWMLRGVVALGLMGGVVAEGKIDAVWQFKDGLKGSGSKAEMTFRGDTEDKVVFYKSEHDLGLSMPFGDDGGMVRFPKFGGDGGFGVDLKNGGRDVKAYTMVWDLFRPATSWKSGMALYQTDVSNESDAEFFISNKNGIGVSGKYDGHLPEKNGEIAWSRVVMTRSGGGEMKKYIDGVLVGVQDAKGERWDIKDGKFLILSDDSGEVSGGLLGSFGFSDRVLSEKEVKGLGYVHADGAGVGGIGLSGNPADVSDGSFTVVVIGDTQNYSSGRPKIFNSVTQWVADNAKKRNIIFAIQDGDIVNSGNDKKQWDVSRGAMDRLNGVVPYAVVRGNHDMGSEYDLKGRFGKGSPYSKQKTLKGFYRVPGKPEWDMRNTYHVFKGNGQKFLVLTVDISAGDGVVDWANKVIKKHQDHRVILDTHAYMFDGGERFNCQIEKHSGISFDAIRGYLVGHKESQYNGVNYGGQDGESLWHKLVSKHGNIMMFIAGHQFENFDKFRYHLDRGVKGNKVYELLVDPQAVSNGGNGWIRLLEFDKDGKTIHVKTYSPWLKQWDTTYDVYYDIELSPIKK